MNAGYTDMRRMRNNNLKIRIAGSSCRPQLRRGGESGQIK